MPACSCRRRTNRVYHLYDCACADSQEYLRVILAKTLLGVRDGVSVRFSDVVYKTQNARVCRAAFTHISGVCAPVPVFHLRQCTHHHQVIGPNDGFSRADDMETRRRVNIERNAPSSFVQIDKCLGWRLGRMSSGSMARVFWTRMSVSHAKVCETE